MSRQAFWNGLKTTAVTGTAIVADKPDMPMYWAKTEGIIGERIRVVDVDVNGVNYGGGHFILDDREGQGSRTVFEQEHLVESFVTIEEGSFEPDEVLS